MKIKSKKIVSIALSSMIIAQSVSVIGYADKLGNSNSLMQVQNDAVSGATKHDSANIGREEAFEKGKITEIKNQNVNVSFAAVAVDRDTLSNTLTIEVFGELKMPYSAQDFDVTNSENFKFKPDEYRSIPFVWDDDSEYTSDYTKFKINMKSAFKKGQSEAKIIFNGEEYTIKIPTELSYVDKNELDEAINEHKASYNSASSSGINMEQATVENFLKSLREAERVSEDENTTQEKADEARKNLNEAFSKIKALPFEREELNSQIEKGKTLSKKNGENNKRYTKETFNELLKEIAKSVELSEVSDLSNIVTTGEGEPLKTHKDFENQTIALKNAISSLVEEDYKATDNTKLKELYEQAKEKTPKEGFGYEVKNREEFLNKIDESEVALENKYLNQDEINSVYERLESAIKNLKEVSLSELNNGKDEKQNITVSYKKDNERSFGFDLYENIKDENGNALQSKIEGVSAGQEVRIYLDDEKIIKKFDGMYPAIYSYAGDDTSLKKVKLRTDREGKEYIIFYVEAGASNLDIIYLSGELNKKDYSKNTDKPSSGDSRKDKGTDEVSRTKVDSKNDKKIENKDSKITRIYGKDRYETNLKSVKLNFTKSDVAIVVSGEHYADALSASPYAHSMSAPLIFSKKNEISKEAKDTLKDLEVKKVIIVGGESSVAKSIEDNIKSSLEVSTERISGLDRYETSNQLMKKSNIYKNIIIVDGKDFPDALTSVALATKLKAPIVLNNTKNITDIKNNKSVEKIYIVGGEKSVPAMDTNILNNTTRLSGENRYETAIKVANEVSGNKNILVKGTDYPDALSSINLIKKDYNRNILLTRFDKIDSKVKSITDKNETLILGGYNSVKEGLIGKEK
ncbi:cell wall-binding repeat-containing protein [Peptostreptococcus faecalis]|uniref:cell wall-binding repeat-containing protein n=1 Tax=Peptostreptococcus faecalis TaxID=2045015 RepID=UPI0015E064AC|nr:cell wall-binding repeat-containing protein [Peptostreptococcus faecalis]